MIVWIPENLKKIYPYAPPPEKGLTAGYKFGADAGNVAGAGKVVYGTRRQVDLFGAGNEIRSFQFGLALGKTGRVEIVVPHLKTRNNHCLSREHIKVYRVGCVSLDGALAPDPLFEERSAKITRGVSTAFRVAVCIPAHQPSGIYSGLIRIKSDEGSETIRLLLRVYDFTLPETLSMGLNFWTFPRYYAQQYRCAVGSDKFWQIAGIYAKDLKAHGQDIISLLNVSSASPIKWIDWQIAENGESRFDFSLLDEWIRIHKEAGIDKGIELECSISNTNFELYDLKRKKRINSNFPVGSEKFNRHWGRMLTALARHLREKGWMKGVMIKPADEIREEFVPKWRSMARLVKACDQDFLTTEALGFGRQGLLGYCDVFVMHAWCGMDFIPQIKKAGAQAWWYFSCDCDNPNFFLKNDWIEARAVPWLTWQRQLQGVLRWSYSYWPKDPFEDAYCGMTLPAGDCYMVYPGPDGPITSVRWETLREGSQDYEYLKIFHDCIKKLPHKKQEKQKKQAETFIKRATGLVAYSRNYANYHAAQKYLGEAIESLRRR